MIFYYFLEFSLIFMFSKVSILLAAHAVSSLSGIPYFRNLQVSLVFFVIYFQPLVWLPAACSYQFPAAMSINIQRSWRKYQIQVVEKVRKYSPANRNNVKKSFPSYRT